MSLSCIISTIVLFYYRAYLNFHLLYINKIVLYCTLSLSCIINKLIILLCHPLFYYNVLYLNLYLSCNNEIVLEYFIFVTHVFLMK